MLSKHGILQGVLYHVKETNFRIQFLAKFYLLNSSIPPAPYFGKISDSIASLPVLKFLSNLTETSPVRFMSVAGLSQELPRSILFLNDMKLYFKPCLSSYLCLTEIIDYLAVQLF